MATKALAKRSNGESLLACVLSAIAGAGLSAAESLTSAERKTIDLRERIRFQPKSKERGCAELDWRSLAQINSEIVGWITVSGTSIDLPVALQSKNKAARLVPRSRRMGEAAQTRLPLP